MSCSRGVSRLCRPLLQPPAQKARSADSMQVASSGLLQAARWFIFPGQPWCTSEKEHFRKQLWTDLVEYAAGHSLGGKVVLQYLRDANEAGRGFPAPQQVHASPSVHCMRSLQTSRKLETRARMDPHDPPVTGDARPSQSVKVLTSTPTAGVGAGLSN